MPPLDPVEEAVVVAYLENGGNQSEAWRAGHPNSKAKAQSVHVKASQFFAQDKVRLRIAELHGKVEVKAADAGQILLTIDQHMAELERLRNAAEERGQLSAAIKAEELRGKLRRFYVEQREDGKPGEFSPLSDAELTAIARSGGNGVAAPQSRPAKPDRIH